MKWMEAKKTGGRGKRKKKVAEPTTESETDTDGGFFPTGLAGTDEDEDSEASQKLKVGNRVVLGIYATNKHFFLVWIHMESPVQQSFTDARSIQLHMLG